MGRELTPQLREACVKVPMFLCRISGRPNFKAVGWCENSYQKGILGKEFLNSMATATREIQTVFALTYTLIGFPLTDIKENLLQEF